jgi:predicted DNA-binding antitoxin AbrB/MazE fold protein
MPEKVEAIYENGVLRLVEPLRGVEEHARVKVTVETAPSRSHPLAECIGSMPDDDAEEILRIVEEEFEQVNLREWQ